jgi:hypothetical protein
MGDDQSKVVELRRDEKDFLVEKKATCPFIGSAVAQGKLAVGNSARDPLASIEDVKKLGNSGSGDLGDLLVLFATGNHALMRGDSGKLDKEVPSGLFSLEFPGSQGAHPGHSGILMGDPEALDSGRLSLTDFERLTSRAKGGLIKRSDVGRFIAENLTRDPKSKVDMNNVIKLLGDDLRVFTRDLHAFAATFGPQWLRKLLGSDDDRRIAHRDLQESLTKLLGEDNLLGSAGEFGLLFAFLANKPGAKKVDGEPAVAVEDLKAMFVEKRFPAGSENWKKSWTDWVENTTGLAVSAAKEYHTVRRT